MKSSNDLPIEWVERIFMRLHGRFGNAFYDKFRIGQLNNKGEDLGVENAKQVWSSELAGISGERIAMALKTSFSYPPSCDEFKQACNAKLYKENDFLALAKPPQDETVIAENLEKINNMTAEMIKPKTDYKAWARKILANSKCTEIEIKYAKEALGMA